MRLNASSRFLWENMLVDSLFGTYNGGGASQYLYTHWLRSVSLPVQTYRLIPARSAMLFGATFRSRALHTDTSVVAAK